MFRICMSVHAWCGDSTLGTGLCPPPNKQEKLNLRVVVPPQHVASTVGLHTSHTKAYVSTGGESG